AGDPARTIGIVVRLPPGWFAEGRPLLIGDKRAARWGHPIIIENKTGAAQNLGAELVAKAEPDGYTLLATPQGPLVLSQHFSPRFGFDPAAFVPVTVMASVAYMLVANPHMRAMHLHAPLVFPKD